ncbi:putative E3 ubiquitin-protein ligase [Cryptosporidium felis]|nr:putative E3 ubiquitin-protein ligase [Cryptosporidium felis]
MENNNARQEADTIRTSIFNQILGSGSVIPNFNVEGSRRKFVILFIFLVVILLVNFENKLEGNRLLVNSPIYSSTSFYFGKFQIKYGSNFNLNYTNEYFDDYNLHSAIIGNSRWQFDWAKSSVSSKSAWVALKIQFDRFEEKYDWILEEFITTNKPFLKLKGITEEFPTIENNKFLTKYNCSIEIDFSNDKNFINKLFPQADKEIRNFRGNSNFEQPYKLDVIEFIVKSPNCFFEMHLKGRPFSMGLFRLNVIHFLFLYNLKVLLEIRGGLTQFAHSNSTVFGSSNASNISMSSLIMQMMIDIIEGAFLIYCSFIAPSLLFSSFTLMLLLKWLHISFIQARYIFWIWKSNYLRDVPVSEIPTVASKFYKRLYAFMLGALVTFIIILKTCNPAEKYSRVNIPNKKSFNLQFVPYYIYISLFFFLIPQILSDAYMNIGVSTRSLLPLHPQYIFTSLIGKAFVPIYIWGYSNSIFNTPLIQYLTETIPITTKNEPLLSASIFVIISIQAILYSLQYKYGSKSLIPKIFRPEPYNYFRLSNSYHLTDSSDNYLEKTDFLKEELSSSDTVIPDNSHNNQLTGIDEIELTNYRNQKYTRILCVICMANVSILDDFNNDLCAVCTPCDHVFHQKCLKKWMDIKLECPTCRRRIPLFETK